jgi:pimeloyl-ACP methyl ester carboxylesterase
MDELGIERASMVGSSYGGAVSVVCALDYPDRVEKLCLVGAVINDEPKHQMLLRLAATPVMGDLISPLILNSPRVMRWRLSQIYAPENAHLMTGERMLAHHRPLRAASSHRAVLKTLRKWNAGRVEREATKIGKPTLLVWGEGDADCPLEHGRRLFNSIENSRLVVFRNCGHLPQEEYPSEFVELLTDFLSRQGQPALEERPRIEDAPLPAREAEVQVSGQQS